MKALSIRNPWAAMIVHGQKRIENRSRRTTHRGPIALHSSGRGRWDFAGQVSDLVRDEWRRLGWAGSPDRDSSNIVHGAVLAVAEIVDVCGWQGRSACDCGEWAVPFQSHWKLANVRPLTEPVPCKGALGLWPLPSEVEAAVVAQLPEAVPHGWTGERNEPPKGHTMNDLTLAEPWRKGTLSGAGGCVEAARVVRAEVAETGQES